MATGTTDVIVIGLGGMGSSAAYHLARRGHRVLGLERFGPGHDQGSSHGLTRMVRQAYFENPAYVPLLRRAYELWEELGELTGRPMLRRTGGLMIGRPDASVVAGSLASARTHNLPHDELDHREIRRRFPRFNPGPDEVGVYEEAAGFVRPEETVHAHLDLAQQAGAELHFETKVLEWDADESGVRVRTAEGVHRAEKLVICPGSWADTLLPEIGIELEVQRQVQHWFAPAGNIEEFAPGRHPAWIWETETGEQGYGFPAVDGPDLGVKAAFFRRGGRVDPDQLDPEPTVEEVEGMAEFLDARFVGAADRHLRSEPCLYTCTPDLDPVIDYAPGQGNVVMAVGFSGHGFKFVPVIGELITDLIDERPSPAPFLSLTRGYR